MVQGKINDINKELKNKRQKCKWHEVKNTN